MDQRGGGEGPAPGPQVYSNERVIVSSFLVIKLIWMEGEGVRVVIVWKLYCTAPLTGADQPGGPFTLLCPSELKQ